ncbi:MAG: DNA translocase FtsK [Ruminococcus flavefaciens]|nr:DNA translocase FtsK [Ruminococcus flavefaciens]MCM1229000.1 DNA translocase FtsK [Ruminococcus flavefaciens]
MAEKKKTPFGAEFNEEGYTRKGKPVKKPDNDDGEEEYSDTDYISEMSRVVSVAMFGMGILTALITLIPGSAGWSYMHNALWGICGWAVFAVPILLIYSSVLMGLGRQAEEILAKALWGIGWTVLASSALQIFTVGEIPGQDLLSYIISLYSDGTRLRGGGVISLPVAGILFVVFGKMGARIVIVLLSAVLFLILSGKGLKDCFDVITAPFKFAYNFFIGGEEDSDDDDEYYQNDEDDDDDEYADRDDKEDDDEDDDIVVEDVADDSVQVSPLPEIHGIGENDYRTKEEEEFSMFFDIPLPDEKSAQPESAEKPEVQNSVIDIDIDDNPEENRSFSELERLIENASRKKSVQKQAVIPTEDDDETVEEYIEKPLYVLPDLALLTPSPNKHSSVEAKAEMLEKADTIVKTFDSFAVKVDIVDIFRGPAITRYEVKPGSGIKVSKIRGLEDDIALSLAAQGVRIEAPVPGKAAVGIEVPNINKDDVMLREILESAEFRNSRSKLAFAVGKDITGNAVVGDITRLPHVIIAGTTGSGKSVCTRSIIMSILYNATPDEVKIILIDPKVVEFKIFEGIPHLLIPIVTEAKKAAGALNWAVNEMMRRYNTFADIGANDLKSYNELADDGGFERMPQIVIFIDELADMMLVAGKEVEDSICRLAQMGRAAGMHLVVATQRPTTDVITGLIKANIPSRIALSVMSQVDSRTIIDMAGADKLLGNGDMLYMPIGMSKPIRVQGCFASSKDINATLEFIRSQATSSYNPQIIEAVENFVPQTKGSKGDKALSDSGFEAGSDEDYIIRAAEVAVNAGQLSTTMLQKKLKLGYARASRIMDELEECGIISSPEGSKPRKVLMSKMQFDEWKMRQLEDK